MNEVERTLAHYEKQIDEAVLKLRDTVDTRLLVVTLLAHTAALCETLVSARLVTPDHVRDAFGQACEKALTPRPRDTPVPIHTIDCGKPVQKH